MSKILCNIQNNNNTLMFCLHALYLLSTTFRSFLNKQFLKVEFVILLGNYLEIYL